MGFQGKVGFGGDLVRLEDSGVRKRDEKYAPSWKVRLRSMFPVFFFLWGASEGGKDDERERESVCEREREREREGSLFSQVKMNQDLPPNKKKKNTGIVIKMLIIV